MRLDITNFLADTIKAYMESNEYLKRCVLGIEEHNIYVESPLTLQEYGISNINIYWNKSNVIRLDFYGDDTGIYCYMTNYMYMSEWDIKYETYYHLTRINNTSVLKYTKENWFILEDSVQVKEKLVYELSVLSFDKICSKGKNWKHYFNNLEVAINLISEGKMELNFGERLYIAYNLESRNEYYEQFVTFLKYCLKVTNKAIRVVLFRETYNKQTLDTFIEFCFSAYFTTIFKQIEVDISKLDLTDIFIQQHQGVIFNSFVRVVR